MTIKQVREMFFAQGTEFSRAEERAFAREDLIYNVTEDVLVVMEELGVSKKELARRLGRSRSFVTQLLDGARNMTLGTLSDICFALDITPRVILQGDHKSRLFPEDGEAHWEAEPSAAPQYEVLNCRNIIDRRDQSLWEGEAA